MRNAFFTVICALALCATAQAEPLITFSCNGPETIPESARNERLDKDCFQPGVVGNGLYLTGMENIMLPLPKGFGAKPLTISGYFRPDYFRHGGMMTILSFFHHPREILAVKMIGDRLHAMDWGVYSKSRTIPVTGKLEKGVWHHLTWQMTGSEWVFFIDGKHSHSFKTTMLPATADAQKILLGCDFNHVVSERHFWVGMLDEFRVEEGILSPEQCEFSPEALAAAPKFTGIKLIGARNIKADEKPPKVSIDTATQSYVINGEKTPVMIYAAGVATAGAYVFDTAKECRENSGINVFRLEITPRDFRMGEWWYAPGKYDFTEIDLWLDQVVRRVPDARILLQIPMSPPTWWGIANPKEETCDFTGFRVRDYHASHSFASRKWISDLEGALTALFAHLKQTPYYNRIIGYVPVIGLYNEAFRWGYNSKYKNMTDYSEPERRAFQAYQKARYGTTEKRNSARPKEQAVASFEEAPLPTPEERLLSDGYFSDPVRDRNVIDYLQYLNSNHPDRIREFTDIVRRLCGPDKVIGLYYGYLFSDSYGHRRTFSNESGHYGLAKALELPNVDFLLDSMAHFQREMGNAGPTAGAPAAIQLHNKLWMDEADIRTHLSNGNAEYSGARNLDESLGILWRAFGTIQINRSGLWWFPISGKNAYSHPRIWEAFGRMRKEMQYQEQHPVAADRANTIAFIMDPQAIHFRRYSKDDPVTGNLVTGLLGPVAKAGISYHLHIIEDLERIPDDYKVYVFLNSFHLTDAQRETIRRRFQKKGKLLVWSYASGYFTGDSDARYSNGVENISALTGISIKKASAPAPIPSAGIKQPLSPIFYIDDPNAASLASFSGTGSAELDGKVASAEKTLPNGAKSVYLGIPQWTPQLIHHLAAMGGVHCYTEKTPDYVLRAGNGHILLHSAQARTAALRLPRQARRVVDVMTGEVLAENCLSLEVAIPARGSRYLRIEQ